MTVEFLNACQVALVRDSPKYQQVPPYHPSEPYPEWPSTAAVGADNPAYRSVRKLFFHLGLDSERFGSPTWNPLATIVMPGNTVVLKPNFVLHANIGERFGLTDTDSLVTHGSVIRPVLDYVAKALNGDGKVIVADCPLQGANWERIVKLAGLDIIGDYFRSAFPGIKFEVRDYRLATARLSDGRIVRRDVRDGILDQYYEVDLGAHSQLLPLMKNGYEFGVAGYSKNRMRFAHSLTTNRYIFPKAIVDADVLINLPKLKTHMKAGVTIALKNLVGINGHKDYLPHFRFGSPRTGGDEYPDGDWLWQLMNWLTHREWELDGGPKKLLFWYMRQACNPLYRRRERLARTDGAVDAGSWHGNDTLWRTILDINRAFFYFDASRQVVMPSISTKRRYLAVVDGLVVGEKESPLSPSPRPAGLMLAGFNPVAVDSVGTAMIGFDTRKIKQVAEAFSLTSLPLASFHEEDIVISGTESVRSTKDIYKRQAYIPCKPSRGMLGHVEWQTRVHEQHQLGLPS